MVLDPGKVETRPWGRFVVLHKDRNMWLKRLVIAPGASLSLQYHMDREEYWYTEDNGVRNYFSEHDWVPVFPGVVQRIAKGEVHRISNPTDKTVIVTEWAVGLVSEDDIIRIADDYGRRSEI